jgi:hypothetical protein
MSKSAVGGVARTALAIATISVNCSEVPCIFQFPAIKGCMDSTLRARAACVCSLGYSLVGIQPELRRATIARGS